MAGHTLQATVRHIRRTAGLGMAGESDAELLRRYSDGDALAFETLVRRYGPMVLAINRHLLHDSHAAEDVFQVAFLALARKASSIVRRGSVGRWLSRVTFRAALRARNAAPPRPESLGAIELPDDNVKEPAAVASERELQVIIAEELSALPERYRVVLALHHFGGRTCDQVATDLSCRRGTVAARLSRGRAMLRRRLLRRGLSASCVGLPLGLAGASIASVPREMIWRATVWAADAQHFQTVPTRIILLTDSVLRAMAMTKIKSGVLLVVLGMAASGVVVLPNSVFFPGASAQAPPATEQPTDRGLTPTNSLEARLKQVEDRLNRLEARSVSVAPATPPAGLGNNSLSKQESQAGIRSTKLDQSAAREVPSAVASVAARFKHKVPFEVGRTYLADGGHLEIVEVWGTRPAIEIGGQYVVRGKYNLPSKQEGRMYLHLTANSQANATSYELDLQNIAVAGGQGEFTLMHAMGATGWLHVTLIGKSGDKDVTYADQYFGTGDTVYRTK
jgi:RNA polymerase sigma factor (sigma-70 family)